MADQLFDGRRFRLLTRVDDCTRESLAIEVSQRLTGDDVTRVLDRIRCERGALPKKIRVDNGSEFTSKRLDQWAYLSGVRLDFSRPGTPTDNGLIEAFNGRLRAECLKRKLVPVAGRREGKGRSLALALQYGPTPTAPWATWPPRSSRPYPARSPRPHDAKDSLCGWHSFGDKRRCPKTHPATGAGMGTSAKAGAITSVLVSRQSGFLQASHESI